MTTIRKNRNRSRITPPIPQKQHNTNKQCFYHYDIATTKRNSTIMYSPTSNHNNKTKESKSLQNNNSNTILPAKYHCIVFFHYSSTSNHNNETKELKSLQNHTLNTVLPAQYHHIITLPYKDYME